MQIIPWRSGVPLFLFVLIATGATRAGIAQEDQEDEAARQKFEATARAETMIMVPMRDGARLATDVYLPREGQGEGSR